MRLVVFALLLFFVSPAFAADKESAFDRVMRTGVLKCGYYIFPPMAEREGGTGPLKGLSIDTLETIARRAGLKVEWAEEVTFGNYIPALQAGRFDAVCGPMWPDISVSKAVAFSKPMFYAGLSPAVKVDDKRFSGNDLSVFNSPDVTFVAQDGNALDALTREAFPKAKINLLTASADTTAFIQEIISGKADASLFDVNAIMTNNKSNPIKIKLIAPDKPVKLQKFSLVVKRDEMILKDFLDGSIEELQNDGTMDRLLTKWEPTPKAFLRVAPPYQVK